MQTRAEIVYLYDDLGISYSLASWDTFVALPLLNRQTISYFCQRGKCLRLFGILLS